MSTISRLVVSAKENESLSSLCLAIEDTFPEIDEQVEAFRIKEGKKGLFSSGDPIVKEIEIILKVTDLTTQDLSLLDNIVTFIKSQNIGELEVFTSEEE